MRGITKAFCINLVSAYNRREHCAQEYSKTTIEYEFFNAIDGRVQNIQSAPPCSKTQEDHWNLINETALTFAFFNRETNSAERACALSHLQVWKKISDVSDEFANSYFMVNEDDFNVLNTEGLADALGELQTLDFEMVYLGYRGGKTKPMSVKTTLQKLWHIVKFALSQKTNEEKFRRNLVLWGKPRKFRRSKFFLHAGMTWGGHAYLLNRAGARKLISYNENLRFLPDEVFRYAILDGNLKAAQSKVKYFGCDTKFGSDLRSQEDHDTHHQLFPST